jgi:signal recognition particle GTPase
MITMDKESVNDFLKNDWINFKLYYKIISSLKSLKGAVKQLEEHLLSRLSRLEVQIENIEKSLDVVQAETKANNQLCNELNKMVIELKISNENTTKMIEEVKGNNSKVTWFFITTIATFLITQILNFISK